MNTPIKAHTRDLLLIGMITVLTDQTPVCKIYTKLTYSQILFETTLPISHLIKLLKNNNQSISITDLKLNISQFAEYNKCANNTIIIRPNTYFQLFKKCSNQSEVAFLSEAYVLNYNS